MVAERRAHAVLGPLTDDQQRLVEVVFAARQAYGTWPNVRYVDREVRSAAVAIISSLPTLGTVHYSAVWARSTAGVHHDDDQVGLTIVGLAHVDGGDQFCAPFFRFLRYAAERLEAIPNHPTDLPKLTLRLQDLVHGVRLGEADASLQEVDAVIGLLPHEPPTWHGAPPANRDDWTWHDVPWHVTRFAGVASIPDYVERMWEWTRPSWVMPSASTTPAEREALSEADGSQPLIWEASIHRALLAHIEDHVRNERWATAVREAGVYLEHELRQRGSLPAGSVGVDLATAALKPSNGTLVMPPNGPVAEQEGWLALGRGFMGAIRNRFAHGLPDVSRETAASAISVASLILLSLDEHYPS